MLWTKFKYENKQRAITQKLSKRELWFLCTAHRLDEIYAPMKFHNRSYHSLGDMLRTKNGGRSLPATGDNIIRPVFDRCIISAILGRKHSEKGEIACLKQFLLFSQCFPQLNIFSVSKLRHCVGMGQLGTFEHRSDHTKASIYISHLTNSLTLSINFRCFQTEKSADDELKLCENGRKFPK